MIKVMLQPLRLVLFLAIISGITYNPIMTTADQPENLQYIEQMATIPSKWAPDARTKRLIKDAKKVIFSNRYPLERQLEIYRTLQANKKQGVTGELPEIRRDIQMPSLKRFASQTTPEEQQAILSEIDDLIIAAQKNRLDLSKLDDERLEHFHLILKTHGRLASRPNAFNIDSLKSDIKQERKRRKNNT